MDVVTIRETMVLLIQVSNGPMRAVGAFITQFRGYVEGLPVKSDLEKLIIQSDEDVMR